jgi:3-oxoacyl-[acyl-carrier protein] reductase
MKLEGKVAIVTGASSGIGRATAYALAMEGAGVTVNYRQNRDSAEEVVGDIQKSGGKAIAQQGDISRDDDVNKMVQKTIDEFGRIDILVNNAAISQAFRSSFQDSKEADWRAEIDTTLIGTLFCCRAVFPHLLKQRSGRIICLSSVAALQGRVLRPLYTACKAAIQGLVRALALEVGTLGITVNSVSPGVIMTERIAKFIADRPDLDLEKEYASMNPIQRLGTPDDIAAMIVFLASDEASFITGQNYCVDGGQRM